jgi:cytochrome c-type biogenesis protein
MGDWFISTTGSGSMLLAVPLAIAAGLVSFFSPCVIPMLPGYLSYATGLSGADIAAGTARRSRMLLGALLFVLGFSVWFVVLGLFFGSLAGWMRVHQTGTNIVLGVIAIVLGLAFMGFVPGLQRDVRVHRVPSVGLVAAPVLGFLFGVGWSPCIGPTLGVILTLAIGTDTSRGGVLLAFYSVGLGVPFIVAALAWRKMLGAISFVRRHHQWVLRIGGAMMIVVGILLVTGWWAQMNAWLQYAVVSTYVPSV